MFTTLHPAHVARDAFGLARIGQSRQALMGIRFNGPDPSDNDRTGGDPDPTNPPKPTPPPAGGADDLGFPANTPVAEMTDAQQAAYWRHESKKQQKIADSRKDYDTVLAERNALKDAHASDEDKAIEAAKKAGAAEATEKHLKTAVRGHLLALTKRDKADIDKALEFIDVTRFANADGDLDDEKLDDFAKTLGAGASGGTPPADPIRDALDRQRQGGSSGGGQGGGSIAAQEQLEYERLTGKTTQ